MKNWHCLFIPIFIACYLALCPLESGAGTMEEYGFVVPIPKKSQGMKRFDIVPLLETGTLPFPRPSRRQIIDADKGQGCLVCHRLPYPTAPQKQTKPGEEVLSSMLNTPQGGWRLLTPSEKNHHERAGGWSPDGK